MYQTQFGFRRLPFSLTPDPRFLYLSAHHREALAHLLYGVGEGGGFVQLTGEVGTGKTTLCRSVLEQAPEKVDLALVLNPRLTPLELVATVCDELGAEYPAETTSNKTLVDTLTRRLLEGHAAGRRAVVVIDEAQNLDTAALEQIRLLTNLETPTQKLLQIVLIGQPELQELLARPDLRQLAQRITARYHLPPLSREETTAYVRHRLRVAGGSPDLFTPAALRLLHRASDGIPRRINILCDRALLGAYARESNRVGPGLVRSAVREIAGQARPRRTSRAPLWGAALLAAALVAATTTHQGDLRQFLASLPASAPSVAPPQMTQMAPEPPAPAPLADPVEGAQSPPAEGLTTEVLRQLFTEAPPSEAPGETSLDQLLSLWGVSPRGDQADACAAAAQAGLLCYRSRGSWAEVVRLNRPVVLELQLAPGRRGSLLVAGIDGDHLLWWRGGETERLPRAAVEPLWYGEFTLLWRPPPGGTLVLGKGSEGGDVVWLAERLGELDPTIPRPPPPTRFDARLSQQVRDAQHRLGLKPDGVAGRETIMRLNAALDPGIPQLTPDPS
ncbi:MAG: AAA family ATPase [Deferrisomatales bacterium]|nr:AAA family ATPase [Deferrisomatales bacterium]